MDCMELMKQYPDNYFDLAVVDPPYGIKEDGRKTKSRDYTRFDPRNGRRINCAAKKYKLADWDNQPPDFEYFNEVIRVSKNQIIWGANHFISRIPFDSSCWIVWNKFNGENDFADCELAWTSFNTAVRKFDFMWAGFRQGKSITEGSVNQGNKSLCEKRIHPTQKPVALYDWIFANYAKPTDKILDTHLGSGSSRIAANKAGLEFIGCELDKEYFEAQEKRFEQFTSQLRMF